MSEDEEDKPAFPFASILLLNAPTNLLMGLDYCQWRITPRFMGMTYIPEGAHFIYWESYPEDNTASYAQRLQSDSRNDNRLGCFIFLNKEEVLTWRWDTKSCTFFPLSPEEHMAYSDGLRHGDFLGNLAPFQEKFNQPWKDLTCFITPNIVNRIEPVKKVIYSELSRQGRQFGGNWDPDAAPSLPYGTGLFYTDIPQKNKPRDNTTPHERSIMCIDTSTRLDTLIEQWNGNELCVLGELQFAYISFLLGFHYISFEQWKALLILLSNSESAFTQRPALFSGLFSVFYTQLEQAPDDLLSDELLADNFILHCIINLLEISDYPNTYTSPLHQPITHFAKLVETKFGMPIEALPTLTSDGPTIYTP